MSLRGKIEAAARGEVSAEPLVAYGRANTDAYELLDSLPPVGAARLAAWCAFVLQTHGDNLVSCEPTPGYVPEATFLEVQMLYELTAAWLNRAHSAAADPSYQLDVSVPQRMPSPPDHRSDDQLAALKKTLETIQARVGMDIESRKSEPIYARVASLMLPLQAALDVGGAISKHAVSARGRICQTLHDGIDRGYELGQLLAIPDLLARPVHDVPARPENDITALQLFLPGDPGFDPWCLTDPFRHLELEAIPTSAAKLAALWANDPEPEATLAMQARILAAIQAGVACYFPEETGTLARLGRVCPWPAVMHAMVPFSIAGTALEAGDRFVLTAGGTRAAFKRALVRIPANAGDRFEDDDPPPRRHHAGGGVNFDDLISLGLDVLFFPLR